MDGFSAAAAVIGLAEVVSRVVVRAAQFVRDSKNVDVNLLSFHSEVATLDINLRLVGRTILAHPEISTITDHDVFLKSINDTVPNCAETISGLQKLVDKTPFAPSAGTFERLRRQRKLDKMLPEMSALRYEIVSYNSSLQTVLQAINISINLDARIHTNAENFSKDIFSAIDSLRTQLEELRLDIGSQLHMRSQLESVPDPTAQLQTTIEAVVASMKVAETFAERVYSKASTVSESQAEGGLIHDMAAVRLVRSPSSSLEEANVREESPMRSRPLELKLLIAQNRVEEAISSFYQGHLDEPARLCANALENLSSVQHSPVGPLTEYVRTFQALLYSCSEDKERVELARRFVKRSRLEELEECAIDELMLKKMSLISWIQYHLGDYEGAERTSEALFDKARIYEGDRNNTHCYGGLLLLSLIAYLQRRQEDAQGIAGLISPEYLEKQLARCPNSPGPAPKYFERLCQPGCIAAAFSIFHLPLYPLDKMDIVVIAAKKGSTHILALLEAKYGWQAFASPRHLILPDFQLPLYQALDGKKYEAFEFMLNGAPSLQALYKVVGYSLLDSDLPAVDLRAFMLIVTYDRRTKQGKSQNGLEQPLHFLIRNGSSSILMEMLESGMDLDISEVDREAQLLPLGLVCSHDWRHARSVIALLVKRGADVNGFVGCGKRPIHVAVEEANFDALKELIAQGALVDAEASADASWEKKNILKGRSLTALELATSLHDVSPNGEQYPIICRLLTAGARMSTQTKCCEICLAAAKETENFEAMGMVAKALGPRASNTTYDGVTMLQMCMQMVDHRRVDKYAILVVECLINTGSDPMQMVDNETCVRIAIREESPELLQALLNSKQPLNVDVLDHLGKSFMQRASHIENHSTRKTIESLLVSAAARQPSESRN